MRNFWPVGCWYDVVRVLYPDGAHAAVEAGETQRRPSRRARNEDLNQDFVGQRQQRGHIL